MNFKQPVSMPCTYEQYEADLEKPLKELGYVWSSSYLPINGLNKMNPLLTTKYGSLNNGIGQSKSSIPGRHHLETYNPKLFLAIAAMSDEEYGIPGEWWVFLEADNPRFIQNKLYKANSPINEISAFINEHGRVVGSCIFSDPRQYFRKATLEELINHFETNNIMKNQQITRNELVDLSSVSVCPSWIKSIKSLLESNDFVYAKGDEKKDIPQIYLDKLLKEGTEEQKRAVEELGIEIREKDLNFFKENIDKNDFYKVFGHRGIQILTGATPDDRPELKKKALFVRNNVDIIVTELPYTGTKMLEFRYKR